MKFHEISPLPAGFHEIQTHETFVETETPADVAHEDPREDPCPELPTSLGLGGRSATMIGRMPRVACTAQRGFIGVAHLPTIGQCVITAHDTDSRFDDLCDGGVLAAAPAAAHMQGSKSCRHGRARGRRRA